MVVRSSAEFVHERDRDTRKRENAHEIEGVSNKKNFYFYFYSRIKEVESTSHFYYKLISRLKIYPGNRK